MVMVMMMIITIASITINDDDSYDRLSKCIENTTGELFNGDNKIKIRLPQFDKLKKLLLEKIKEQINTLKYTSKTN